MTNASNAPIRATGAAQGASGAPEAPSAQPFALPDGMTAEAAHQRIRELQQDKDFGAKWLANGNDSPEGRMMDALNKCALGMAPDKPVAPPDENAQAIAALGAPADISGYDLNNIHGPDGGFIRMDEATRKLANTELLPEARALDLSSVDVAMVASNIANPTSYEDCESTLKRLWGADFEVGLNDFRLAMAGTPKARGLVEAYPETLGNNPMLISAVVASWRRKQGRR